jgi:hypothetical protein
MLSGLYNFLSPSGIYVYISFGQPHFRIGHYLKNYAWNIKVKEFGSTLPYFFYTADRHQADHSTLLYNQKKYNLDDSNNYSESEEIQSQRLAALAEGESEDHLLQSIDL